MFMMNLLTFVMLHSGTGLQVCTARDFIARLLQEMPPCGWLRYSSVFSSAVITMTETGNCISVSVVSGYFCIASPLQGSQRLQSGMV